MSVISKSRDRVFQALNHQNTNYVPVDLGFTTTTGIHCRIVEALRSHHGLESKPVKIVDASQVLDEADEELAELLGVDCIGIDGAEDIFDLDTA